MPNFLDEIKYYDEDGNLQEVGAGKDGGGKFAHIVTVFFNSTLIMRLSFCLISSDSTPIKDGKTFEQVMSKFIEENALSSYNSYLPASGFFSDWRGTTTDTTYKPIYSFSISNTGVYKAWYLPYNQDTDKDFIDDWTFDFGNRIYEANYQDIVISL